MKIKRRFILAEHSPVAQRLEAAVNKARLCLHDQRCGKQQHRAPGAPGNLQGLWMLPRAAVGAWYTAALRRSRRFCTNSSASYDRARSFSSTERTEHAWAFTLTELLVALVVLSLVAVLAFPALANSKMRSQRVGCVTNLSQIGRAFNLWATDHGERYPFQLDYSEGGTREHPTGLQHGEWFQFSWISNELVTPRVLACPADYAQKTAANWGIDSDGGFLNSNFRNKAISYLLAHPFVEDGRQMLCADRSLSVSSLPRTACPYLGVGIANISPSTAGWADGIHQASGNVLFNDGSVDELDDSGVRRALSSYQPSDVIGVIHAVFPTPPIRGPVP